MRRVYWLVLISGFMVQFASAHQVVGICTLGGETTHGGTVVRFMGMTDTLDVYTNEDGTYAATLNSGAYDIRWSKFGFQPEVSSGVIVDGDTTLQARVLARLPEFLSGSLSGILHPSDYRVTGDILVEAGDSLRIMPGTTLRFSNQTELLVRGHLVGAGQPDAPINMQAWDPDLRWLGIEVFSEASHACSLRYTVIREAKTSAMTLHAPFHLDHCVFRNNIGTPTGDDYIIEQGGAILMRVSYNCEAVYCDFEANQANRDSGKGGGVFVDAGLFDATHCTFNGNSVGGARGRGGAIHLTTGTLARIDSCVFIANQNTTYDGDGSAVYARVANVDIRRSVFLNNISSYAVYALESNLTFSQNTMIGGGPAERGLVLDTSTYNVIDNCILDGLAVGLYAFYGDANVQYTCFSNNTEDFTGGGIPGWMGELTQQNENGATCDQGYNIYQPAWLDSMGELLPGSPCIDAGDPALPFDPDGTIADMGAFYHDQTVGVEEPGLLTITPRRTVTLSAYPNPANARATVVVNLSHPGEYTLSAINLLGQTIQRGTLSTHVSGRFIRTLDLTGLSTGTLFLQLEGPDDSAVHAKLLVLK